MGLLEILYYIILKLCLLGHLKLLLVQIDILESVPPPRFRFPLSPVYVSLSRHYFVSPSVEADRGRLYAVVMSLKSL